MTTEAQVKQAIFTILSDTAKYSTSLNYAINYCEHAMQQSGHELAVQCLYILGNISSWRHPQAREVRAILKSFAKEN